jgi:hypothetical protein
VGLRRSCVKRVNEVRMHTSKATKLSTSRTHYPAVGWKNSLAFPCSLHTFSVQFYPAEYAEITELSGTFSPLSTSLIISTAGLTKENLVIGNGG